MPVPKIYSAGFVFQARDLALLRGLFESRLMTTAHIAALYFDRKPEAAKKRLQKIKAAGFIGERKRRVNEASLLFLTRKSYNLLLRQGDLSRYPPVGPASFLARTHVSSLTLRHELEVMDVKAAFHSEIRKALQYEIAEFSTWPLLYQFEAAHDGYGYGNPEVLVKPDGFIRIHERETDGGFSEHVFFLEVDRSSETQAILVSRAISYFDYYRCGGFAERNGAAPDAYKDYPFRVLMVFKTAERRNNTAERLLQSNPPISTQACLSTLAEVRSNPLGSIWLCPADYRDAITGTPFDLTEQSKRWGYQRQAARDRFVEQKVRKWRILADEPRS